MDIFAQKKLLIRLVVLLAILNLLVIGVLLFRDFGRPHHPPHPPGGPGGPGNFHDVSGILEHELKLSPQQVVQLNRVRSDFFERERTVLDLIRSQRDSMNAQMFNKETDEALVMALARRISENEYRMETLRFEQAKAFKAICTPEQLERFEAMVLEIRDYYRPDNQPRGR